MFHSIEAVEAEIQALATAAQKHNSELKAAKKKKNAASKQLDPVEKLMAEYTNILNMADKAMDLSGRPQRLEKYLEKRGYESLSELESRLEQCRVKVNESKQEVRLASKHAERANGQASELRGLISRYAAEKTKLHAMAQHDATTWLVSRCEEAGLPPDAHTKAGLEKLCGNLRQHICQSAHFIDEAIRTERAGGADTDLAVDCDVCEYLAICLNLQLGTRLDPHFPMLLQMAKAAFDGYLKNMFEALMKQIYTSITSAQACNHDKKLQIKEAHARARSDGTCDSESPDGLQMQLRAALTKLEHIEKTYPALFAVFEKLNMGCESLQCNINRQLVSLHTRLEQDLIAFYSAQQMREHEAKVEVTQSMAISCDDRFQKFDPKPQAVAQHGSDTWGSFSALFLHHHTLALQLATSPYPERP